MFTEHKNIISLETHYRNILDAFAHEGDLLGETEAYITLSKILYKLGDLK